MYLSLDDLPQLPQDESCTPGKSYKQDCNTCVCSSKGLPACTYKYCLKSKRSVSEELRELPLGENCTPGQSFKRDCNTCVCSADGLPACTLSLCPKPKRQVDPLEGLPELPSDGECTPGQVYRQDCNVCYCGPYGHAECTYKLCTLTRTTRAAGKNAIRWSVYSYNLSTLLLTCMCLPAAKCYPGEFKYEACNSCRCVGGGWACTRKFCGPFYGEPVARGFRRGRGTLKSTVTISVVAYLAFFSHRS